MALKYYLDEKDLALIWAKIDALFSRENETVKGIQVNGNTLTLTDGIANIEVMSGASADAAGKAGVVPVPPMGTQGKFLRADGSWASPAVTVVSFTQSLTNGKEVGKLTVDGKEFTLYAPTSNSVITGTTTGTTETSSALTNGNVYLNHVENGSVSSSHKIYGDGYATVTADTSGNIKVTVTISDATQAAHGLMSADDKKKLDGIATGAQVNVIETVKVNGTKQTVTGKSVDIDVPTTSEIASQIEAYGYQTASDVSSAIAGAGHLKRTKVSALPATGDDNTIYLVPKTTAEENNAYFEYMYLDSKWEKIGDTEVDLSNYLNNDNFIPITKDQIDSICV